MLGFNVLHPMGWDAFGLPAEQYAIQTGTHPRLTTERNIERFRQQLQMLGFSYDWEREVATTDPGYIKWTQWIFLKLFEMGLAYQAEVPVNWCPALGTVLANEEVIDGKSERGDHPVVRMPMKQWVLRITAYADRLLQDLEDLDWSDSIKDMQRNWIGRSEIAAYVEAAGRKSDFERTELAKDKTGVFTGSYAVNPANGQEVPIWVADYVLGGYGSGAVMAVPAHDARDFEFAQKFGIAPVQVVSPSDGSQAQLPFTETGVASNSCSSTSGLDINGLATPEAKSKVIAWLEETGAGKKQVNYKLRDWLFARQRYWGEPFPLIYPEGSETAVPLPESSLPLELPETEEFKPSGTLESPLATIPSWLNTTDPATGKPARRETSTMPQWAGSCWYYLRFIDPSNTDRMIDPVKEKYWMPVDLYVGGAEHAVLHLLYARFWHKVLYDLGVVSTKEPFGRLVSQGMILGEVEYTICRNGPGGPPCDEQAPGAVVEKVAESDVEKKGDGYVLKSDRSVRVNARAHKMSKSRGNVINPDDVVGQYGGDSLRLYEMFMGPLKETKVTIGTDDMRFIISTTEQQCTPPLDAAALLQVTIETDEMRFNTAIAGMMEFMNAVYKWPNRPRAALEPFVLLLAPYAPHIAEELWAKLGHTESLTYAPWPQYDEALLVQDVVKLPVQINGKVRATLEVPRDIVQDDAVQAAVAAPNVAKYTDGKAIKKVIFVPGKIMNLIVA
ncbi:hypothetical protein DUNSADRAFT_3800 [Dunaliella salina]|uniref:leucine--tRNA ligase n=1 Tax=Dunaliella salina TaxID=3046 RepID=A0ABQ7GT95_DUNSA|nr:hypothetical protein DUNSADRAFT_3800 [Dunaliella salina]|eukprot:KAF5837837.1 hypothetical protein DUNSADRAFT_3800 [Dunaliella salina]